MSTTPPASAAVLAFPERRPVQPPAWLPLAVRQDLAAIEQWCSASQHRLAALPGAQRHHHKLLRAIADELRDEVLAGWASTP